MLFALSLSDAHTAANHLSEARNQLAQDNQDAATLVSAVYECILIAGNDNQIKHHLPTVVPCEVYSVAQLAERFSLDSTYITLPRRGTKTAWSSNALDILKTTGLTSVRAIEQGRLYQCAQPITNHPERLKKLSKLLDPMTEEMAEYDVLDSWFDASDAAQDPSIDLLSFGAPYLAEINRTNGLALSPEEQAFVLTHYQKHKRNPTLTELMMFAQINSEHCRHKIFNATWTVNGVALPKSLFDHIKHTYQSAMTHSVVSAYKDNAAVLAGFDVDYWHASNETHAYTTQNQTRHALLKVETHNHPTAISPYPGAATGVGGEIRDEVATGIGGSSLCGLAGYSVSELPQSPAYRHQPAITYPSHVASAKRIMLEAPIGANRFNNEFGRPNLLGFFRSYSAWHNNSLYGFHKPIMLAGGIGHINALHAHKARVEDGDIIAVVGGPGLRIGVGGGAASSANASEHNAELDFASVQRANPEMQRRAQEAIHRATLCCTQNPIAFMHDVGAGGIANAIPELLKDVGAGSIIHLEQVPIDDATLSPMEIWCNESQERYVVAIRQSQWDDFSTACARESCPLAELGRIDMNSDRLVVKYSSTQCKDKQHGGDKHNEIVAETVIDVPLDFLFETGMTLTKEITQIQPNKTNENNGFVHAPLVESVVAVLSHPTVASKQFLITIGDRSVGGLTVREQMVGAKQVPVADAAIVAAGFTTTHGYASATAERPPVALISPAVSVRLVLAELLTNLASTSVRLQDIIISANWMASCGTDDNDYALYQAVEAASAFCTQLGVTIPVGKDSLSMKMQWHETGGERTISSPVTLVATALAKTNDVRAHLTPELCTTEPSRLWLIDLTDGAPSLGGSIYAHIHGSLGTSAPDTSATLLASFMQAIYELHDKNLIRSYHDRSDGGLMATLCEMGFCSDCGLDIDLHSYITSLQTYGISEQEAAYLALWHEGPGVVVQVAESHTEAFAAILVQHQLADCTYVLGAPNNQGNSQIHITNKTNALYSAQFNELHHHWHKTSHDLQGERDEQGHADQEQNILTQPENRLHEVCHFTPQAPKVSKQRPRIAIVRERGTNGHNEMAYAFGRAGFEAVDVSMQSLLNNEHSLSDFNALAACGGFSYGDVFGAGRGWASGILHNASLRAQFSHFFHREDTLAYGVCNGCQLFSLLSDIIPGGEFFSQFVTNSSQQYESRLVNLVVEDTPAVALAGMRGAQLVVPVAHGEGRVSSLHDDALVAFRYVNANGTKTQTYPLNPNGSQDAAAGLTNATGRVLLMMPHPERVILKTRETWRHAHTLRAQAADADSAWMEIFYNMYRWFQ